MNRIVRGIPPVAFAVCLIVGTAAQGEQADTVVVSLADAERMALESSPLLASAFATVELSRAQQTQANHARILPELNLRNVWGPAPRARGEFTDTGVLISPDTLTGLGDLTWFTQVDLSLVQPLYTFGKIGSQLDAVRAQVDVTRADLERTRSEVLLQVRKLYWGVVLSGELAGVSASMSDRVQEAEERLQELYDEGSASQNDMFKFQMFKYEVSSRSREVEAGRIKVTEALRALIGVPQDVSFRVATESLHALETPLDSLSVYLDEASANRAELAQLEAGIQARRALVRAAEAEARPSLFLAGGFSVNKSPGRFDPRNPFVNNPTNFSRPKLLLGLNWNLNFRQTSDRARVERFQVAKLEAQARPLRLMVEQQVREAYLDAVRARADVAAGGAALRASENLLRAELQTFDIGIGDIEDVISAFKSNVGMAVEQFRNVATLNSKLAELSQRVGRDIG
jgi:outer membrane protein TolC